MIMPKSTKPPFSPYIPEQMEVKFTKRWFQPRSQSSVECKVKDEKLISILSLKVNFLIQKHYLKLLMRYVNSDSEIKMNHSKRDLYASKIFSNRRQLTTQNFQACQIQQFWLEESTEHLHHLSAEVQPIHNMMSLFG